MINQHLVQEIANRVLERIDLEMKPFEQPHGFISAPNLDAIERWAGVLDSLIQTVEVL